MPLLATLDAAAFDALPDTTALGKDSYVKNEKDGTYTLNMSGEEAAKLAIGLQKEKNDLAENNKKLLQEKVDKIKELEPWQKIGKTPEEIAEILKSGKTPDAAKVEEEYKKKLESLEQEKNSAAESAKIELETASTRALELEKELQATIQRTVIAELKGEYEGGKAFDKYVADAIRVVKNETTGKYETQVVDEKGQPRYKAGQLMTAKEYAAELKADPELAGLFHAGTAGGSGADARQKAAQATGGFVRADDADALGANLADIATGKVKVV